MVYEETLSSLPVPLVVGEFIVREGWDTGLRLFKDHTLIYFPAGSDTKFIEEDSVLVLDRPCLVLTRPDVPHRYIFDSALSVRHVFVHFSYGKCIEAEIPQVLASSVSFLPIEHPSLVPRFMRHLVNLAYTKPTRWKRRCSELLSATLGEVDDIWLALQQKKTGGAPPPPILRALKLMDKYVCKEISIDQIAREVGWTHEHFSRMFTKHLGIPPQQKLMDIRVEKACQWLVQTELTVQEVAFKVGVDSEPYFCRMFKKIKGITPSQFRNQFSDPGVQHLGLTEDDGYTYPMNRSFGFEIKPG